MSDIRARSGRTRCTKGVDLKVKVKVHRFVMMSDDDGDGEVADLTAFVQSRYVTLRDVTHVPLSHSRPITRK